MSWKIFKGTEAEGKYVGRDTLFIQGDPPYHTLLEAFVESGCSHIYFGAQFRKFEEPSKINYIIVNKLIKAGYAVTVDGTVVNYDLVYFLQTELFKQSPQCNAIISTCRVEDVVTFAEYDGPKQNVWFKLLNFETKKAVLFCLAQLQIPDKSFYETDELVAEGE